MTDRAGSFATFYAAYLAEHRHPANRLLHLAAKVAAITLLGVAVSRHSLGALAAAPVFAVAPCWLGHLLFERNRPTAWSRPSASLLGWLAGTLTRRAAARPDASRGGRPYYSLLADLLMCSDLLRGRSPSPDRLVE
jgi:hypothetical protein